MQTYSSVEPLTVQVDRCKDRGLAVGFVPTMGDLHEGHLSLIRLAREKADCLVVSIFVNPLQFGPSEDFDRYPRQLEQDLILLERERVDVAFSPDVETMYPGGREAAETMSAGELGAVLCGAGRPGHFDGVATVVERLFRIVRPDFAVFGQKDYQQLLVIRRLVKERGIPVEIIDGPTCRGPDGLAISSRNRYLSEEERALAPRLFAELQTAGEAVILGGQETDTLLQQSRAKLTEAGFRLEYLELRRAEDLAVPAPGDRNLVLLAAARLGSTRLIDNLLFSL